MQRGAEVRRERRTEILPPRALGSQRRAGLAEAAVWGFAIQLLH
jgi:hypothetical protein